MKRTISNFLSMIAAAALLCSCGATTPTTVDRPSADEVRALTQRVADWQMNRFEFQVKYRAQPKQPTLLNFNSKKNYPENSDHPTTLYDGLYKFATIADDSSKYINWIEKIAAKNKYRLDDNALKPENQAVTAIYIKLSKSQNNPSLYEESKEQIDRALEIVNHNAINWQKCNYAYSTAPSFAALSNVTGDKKYIEYMDKQLRSTIELLYDPEEQLYYHDKSYFGKRDDDGNKQFWARGNGWMLGALAKVIPQFEEGSENRRFYVEKFQELANRVCELQLPNGAWPLMLLSESDKDFIIESSSASLITYGLAWGVNNGILDSEKFEQPIFKAWYALAETVDDEGIVGYSQCERDMSCNLSPHFTELFTGGAFLNAGSELYLYLSK